MLQIKSIQPDHWSALKAVRLAALADAPYAFGTTLAEAQAYSNAEWQKRARRFSEDPPAAGCIAFWDGMPCGLASVYPSSDDAHAAGLTSFWVAPGVRGQGVGEAMVMFVADWAASLGFTVLEADVVEDNARARAFYAKAGFRETGGSEPFRGDPSKRILRLTLALP